MMNDRASCPRGAMTLALPSSVSISLCSEMQAHVPAVIEPSGRLGTTPQGCGCGVLADILQSSPGS